jgi:predicted nucleic acid-binding protein
MLRPRDAGRAANLDAWLTRLLSIYGGRILPFDQDVADRWGKVMALHPSMPVLDTQIAATALHHGMTVATRNVRDFVTSGVPVFDPF